MCKRYKNKDQKHETTKTTPNANVQKGTQTYKTELPKFANEPEMYKR